MCELGDHMRVWPLVELSLQATQVLLDEVYLHLDKEDTALEFMCKRDLDLWPWGGTSRENLRIKSK